MLPKRATVRRRSGGGRSCEGAAAAAAQGPCTPCQVKSQLSQVYTGSRKVPTSRRRARKRANVLPVGNQISPASLTRSTTACARSGSTAPLSHGSASAPCPSWATSRWHRKTRSFGHSPTSATPTCSTSRFDGKGGQLNLLLNLLRAPAGVYLVSLQVIFDGKESKHDAVLSKLAVEHAPHGKLINNHGKMRPCYVEARKQMARIRRKRRGSSSSARTRPRRSAPSQSTPPRSSS